MTRTRPTRAPSHRPGRLLLAVLVGGLLAPGRVGAEEERVGLTLRPSLRLTALAEDNALLRSGATGDLALWVEPRLRGVYARAGLHAGLDLGLDFERYRRHPELDREYPEALGFFWLGPLRGLRLELEGDYRTRPVRLGRPVDEVANRVRAGRTLATLRWRRDLDRADSVSAGLRLAQLWTGRVDLQRAGLATPGAAGEAVRGSYREVGVQLEWEHRLGRRARLFGRSQWRQRDFRELDEVDFRELAFYAGLRGRWSPRLEIESAAGLGRARFGGDRLRRRLLLRLRLRSELGPHWSARAGFSRQLTTDLTVRTYSETSLRVGLDRALGRRTRASLDAVWTHYSEPLASGANRFWALEFRLSRRLTRHARAVLAWRHWSNRGEGPSNPFTQNRFSLEVVYAR